MSKKNGVTGRGLLWEVINSLWIIPAIMFAAFISFFYIGYTARQRKWILWGCFYLAAWALPVIQYEFSLPLQFGLIALILFLLIWIMGIIHALLVRKDYLMWRSGAKTRPQ